jgi:hypothetical protein
MLMKRPPPKHQWIFTRLHKISFQNTVLIATTVGTWKSQKSGNVYEFGYTIYCHAGHGSRSEAGIVGSNPTQGMDVWCVCAFFCVCVVLCLGKRPCDELITRPRSPTVCEWSKNWEISRMLQKWEQAPKWEQKWRNIYIYTYIYCHV